jgi:hypothetical protein
MRRPGLILLLACLPTWIAAWLLTHKFSEVNRAWGFELPRPDFLVGLQWAATLGAVIAFYFLLFDFISWRRKTNDRKNQDH